MELSEIKNILSNLSSDALSYVLSGSTISIASGSTLLGGVNINPDVVTDLSNEKPNIPEIALPEQSEEEKTLDEIRQQVDYIEERFYHDEYLYTMLNYVLESSAILNKSVRTTYLYNYDGGGAGIRREIL